MPEQPLYPNVMPLPYYDNPRHSLLAQSNVVGDARVNEQKKANQQNYDLVNVLRKKFDAEREVLLEKLRLIKLRQSEFMPVMDEVTFKTLLKRAHQFVDKMDSLYTATFPNKQFENLCDIYDLMVAANSVYSFPITPLREVQERLHGAVGHDPLALVNLDNSMQKVVQHCEKNKRSTIQHSLCVGLYSFAMLAMASAVVAFSIFVLTQGLPAKHMIELMVGVVFGIAGCLAIASGSARGVMHGFDLFNATKAPKAIKNFEESARVNSRDIDTLCNKFRTP